MDQLKALAKLVNDSVAEIEKSCTARNVIFPSLSEPFTPESEAARADPAVIEAAGIITAAASQLIALVRPAPLTLFMRSIQFHVSSALAFAVEAHVSEILRIAGPGGLHVKEIAEKSNVHPNKLARCLRLLATEHVFTEVAPDVFANNRISSVIDTGKDIVDIMAKPNEKVDNTNGVSALLTHNYREVFKASAYMPETLSDPETTNSFSITKAAFNRAFRTDLPLFEWLEQPNNKAALKAFSIGMTGTDKLVPPDTLLESFDWASLPAGSKFVDVGGGIGTQTLRLFTKHSHLKYVVQDRAEVIKQGESFWSLTFPEALKKKTVELQPVNFFETQPVKDATIFFLRAILHDWPDDECVQILKVLREAATPTTRLIISGFVLAYAGPESATEGPKPPEPLLANGGHANAFDYMIDLQMLILLNGQERTRKHHEQLFEKSGWKLMKVIRGSYFTGGREFAEAVPV